MANIRLHVYQADGYWPAVCMCCGRKATVAAVRRMSWCPRWVGGVMAIILTRHATVQAPFCDAHKGHWFRRAVLVWSSFVLFFLLGGGSTIIAANLDHGPKEDVLLVALFGWIALFFLWFVIGHRLQSHLDSAHGDHRRGDLPARCGASVRGCARRRRG